MDSLLFRLSQRYLTPSDPEESDDEELPALFPEGALLGDVVEVVAEEVEVMQVEVHELQRMFKVLPPLLLWMMATLVTSWRLILRTKNLPLYPQEVQ